MAFDTGNYKVLITKLSTLGFSKPFLRWLNSYLSDRSHFVQIDDRTSESVNVRFGVPQESILGPILFNLYVSDLQDHLPSSIGSFQYADDTKIYSSCPAAELQRCAQEINSTVNTVSSWSNDSHLALNSKKTKTMLLPTSQMSHVHSLRKNRPAITISDSTLEYANLSKLLGVHFHQHLNYTLKWKEPNRPQRPNRPQFLEGRFGTCWAVLDRKSQNSSRWYQFGPSNFWIGYTKSYFGTSSQFGPSDSQIKIPIWPQQGLLGATAFCRQKGRKETAVFGWSNRTSDTIQSTVRSYRMQIHGRF